MSDNSNIVSKSLLTVVAGITAIVPYIADFNETHVYNPKWPGSYEVLRASTTILNYETGHARFHNGQTMSMGVCLGLGTLWKTWWDNNDNLLTASVFASMYYVTMFSAWYYPGSTAFDPPQKSSVSYPHLFVVAPNLAMVALAYWLEQGSTKSVKMA